MKTFIRATRAAAVCLVVVIATSVQLSDAAAVPTGNLKDRIISASQQRESEPVVAINPVAPERVVVGIVREWVRSYCTVRSSANGGSGWTAAVRLPPSRPEGEARCAAVDLAYAADGSRLFAAYAEVYRDSSPPAIRVAVSEDDGRTWLPSPAALLFPGATGVDLRPKLATPREPGHASIVYLVAAPYVGNEGSPETADTRVVFFRSTDAGTSWSAPRTLQSGHFDFDHQVGTFVTESRAAEGASGEVVVGWRFETWPGLTYGVRIARSTDYGASFTAATTAVSATDEGPSIVGFDLKLGFDGSAHLAYDQLFLNAQPVDENVYYVRSPGPPYATWSTPVNVADEPAAEQSRPALAVQACNEGASLHLTWADSRLTGAGNGYDIFYAQKGDGAADWSENVRVSDRSSEGPAYALDLAVRNSTAVAVWQPGRNVVPGVGGDWDVYASRIRTGAPCQ